MVFVSEHIPKGILNVPGIGESVTMNLKEYPHAFVSKDLKRQKGIFLVIVMKFLKSYKFKIPIKHA